MKNLVFTAIIAGLSSIFFGNGSIQASSVSGGMLIFGRGGDSIHLDPIQPLDGESAKVCDVIYDTLVEFRENTTEIIPALAEAWKSSADGLVWTFYLRQGVKFHDSTPFNAGAVIFSFTRPEALRREFHEEFIDRIVALDTFTVQFQLKTPYAPFISRIAKTRFSIVSPTAVAKFGKDFDNNPVGTGPFKFVQWDKHDKIILTANNVHWTGKPALDGLIFRTIPDNSVRLMELQQGNIHAMEFPNPEDIPLIQGDVRFELVRQPSLNVGFIAMNMDKPPYDNLKVRLAINHAIDKATIIESLYRGRAIPAKNPIPPTLWGYDNTIEDYAYDPELAKQLLAEAGYPNGFETTLWALPVPRSYIPNGIALAEELQSELQDIGIVAKIVTYDWDIYVSKVLNGEHDMAMMGWNSGDDPDDLFYSLLSIPAAEKPILNLSFYRSDEMQDVLERARTSTDRNERIALYREAQTIFHRDAPWVPLVHTQRILVVDRSVKNLKLPPIGWKYLRNVSLELE